MDRLQEAVRFAAERHFGQWRDGETPLPYLEHPIDVLRRLRHTGGVTDEALLCAAALHDVVEATETSHEEIEARFGRDVSDLVRELTREEPGPGQTDGLTKDEVWQLRADMLLAEVKEMSDRAQQVKLSDRISNLLEAKTAKKGKKLDRYVRQSRRILEAIPASVNRPLWQELERTVREMEQG
ncbi:MAG: bifunctional (p)ppGpp synthetase/guanosine-3',5'-bis(diphosphate) 3'-pyrophosphohydrolase [Fimbriimonadaceae bacterium]|nr:bifunctional (p)ppGpp synthetase/guanosine-3',5'-bis(diphosphate) 3'-pyrophosphohydrolase [Fimbriimonadaceae bacterium]QYK54856.1 MAG: bifunctional (p)ppGpp synthetase/guanosine-3',5'-bis(diphosphate) 3'-pyrophosphohydrolase [Fimbriimonadaceae bacterium]